MWIMTILVITAYMTQQYLSRCVYQNLGFSVLKKSVGKLGLGDGEIHEALAGVASSIFDGESVDGVAAKLAVEGLTGVITKLFWIVVVMGVVCVVASCAMKWERLEVDTKTRRDLGDEK